MKRKEKKHPEKKLMPRSWISEKRRIVLEQMLQRS
jgi:hypothetical protein